MFSKMAKPVGRLPFFDLAMAELRAGNPPEACSHVIVADLNSAIQRCAVVR